MEENPEAESKNKLTVDETILNEWKIWMSAKIQNDKENRFQPFEKLKNCEKNLDLSHYRLSILPNTFPYGLKVLNLSFNKLTQIPENLPKTLEVLNIEHNQVCTIPKTLPDSLLYINLSSNTITSLHNKLPKSLIKLDVSHNKLSSLPENLPESLESLDLISNEFMNLPNSLPKSLRKLYVNGNKLKFLPEILPETLEEIYIEDNILTSLPERLPKSLKILLVGGNNLTKINIDSESIIELKLDRNEIETIEYFNLPKLQMINIYSSKLTSLPNLPESLVNLIAPYNNLSVILELPKLLRVLNLGHNNIMTLPKILPPHLIYMKLNNNKLTEFPSELPASLNELNLTDNLIIEIPSSIEQFPKTRIELYGNPLSKKSLEYLKQLMLKDITDCFHIGFDGCWEFYENEVERKPLIEELPNWLDIEFIHSNWDRISKENGARSFSYILYRIRQTDLFKIQEFKDYMSKWLQTLGQENCSAKMLREMTFQYVEELDVEYVKNEEPWIQWILNRLKIFEIILDIEFGKYDHKIEELIKMARKMYRLNKLDQISRKMFEETLEFKKSNTWTNVFDGMEVFIYTEYQIRLMNQLELPINSWKKNKYYLVEDSEFELSDTIKEINDKEQIEFIDFLLIDWQPWKEVLKRWNYEKFTKAVNDIKNEELFHRTLYKRKTEYLSEMSMADLALEIEIQLGTHIQHCLEKNVWYKLTNEFLESMQLKLETLI